MGIFSLAFPDLVTGLVRPVFRTVRFGPKVGLVICFGLVFASAVPVPASAQVQPATATTLPLSITILYFDQSSPLLRPRVKTTLDSLAQLLRGQPRLLATVTGYTDAVGDPALNLALAERRAKAVTNHLKQRGVSGSQINTSWEGPAAAPSMGKSSTIPTIDRRVVVQLSPR